MNRKIIGGASALVVVATGTGLYLAGPALAGGTHDTAAAVTTSPKPNQRQAARRKLPRRVRGLHGQATVRTKNGFRQVDWQRGQLTAKNGAILTVRSLDGRTFQWKTDGNTRVRKDARRSDVAALTTGDFVLVAGPDDNGARTARRVLVPRKVPAKATQTPTPSPTG